MPRQNGIYVATSNQVNETDDTANNFWITGVMFNEGTVAMPFRRCGGDFAGELVRCQRYYCNPNCDSGGWFWGGYVGSGTTYYQIIPFPVSMRITPLVGNVTIVDGATNNAFPATAATFNVAGPNGVVVSKTANANSAGGYFLSLVYIDCEL